MTLKGLQRLIKNISIPPFTIKSHGTIGQSEDRFAFIFIETHVPERKSGKDTDIHDLHYFSKEKLKESTEKQILEIVRGMVHYMAVHEVDEQFLYKDKRIFDPHKRMV